MRNRPALTLVELVIVMSLIVLVSTPFVISFSKMKVRGALVQTSRNMANNVRTARIYAREEKDEASWGIRFVDEKNYTMVSGKPTSYVVKKRYMLEEPIVFEDSFEDIWFGQSNGETDKHYEITLLAGGGLKTKINISKAGIVNLSDI